MNFIERKYRAWRLRRDIRRAVALLIRIDYFMRLNEWPEWRRQQFWRDFVKSPRARETIFAELAGPPYLKKKKPKPGGKT